MKCNNCNGTGFDGFDRSYPPNQYICDNCEEALSSNRRRKYYYMCKNCGHSWEINYSGGYICPKCNAVFNAVFEITKERTK